MDKFRVFGYMLMRDASLKQRIPCIKRISIFGPFSARKKCALYTGKYGNRITKNGFDENIMVAVVCGTITLSGKAYVW